MHVNIEKYGLFFVKHSNISLSNTQTLISSDLLSYLKMSPWHCNLLLKIKLFVKRY